MMKVLRRWRWKPLPADRGDEPQATAPAETDRFGEGFGEGFHAGVAVLAGWLAHAHQQWRDNGMLEESVWDFLSCPEQARYGTQHLTGFRWAEEHDQQGEGIVENAFDLIRYGFDGRMFQKVRDGREEMEQIRAEGGRTYKMTKPGGEEIEVRVETEPPIRTDQ